jgi:PKD domain
MIDVKKLIVGFLILALATGASALVISNIGGSSSPAAASNSGVTIADATPTSTPSIGSNAFIAQPSADDQVVDDLADATAPVVTGTSSDDDPNNLTDLFADSYMGGVIGANPNGPTDDANGDPTLTPPDPYGIANVVAEASATQELQVPNWDTEAASQPILTLATSSPEAVTQYGEALSDAMGNHLNAQVDAILDNADTADVGELNYVQSQIQQALGDTLALQTPAPLVNLQKSMVKVLVYDKNSLGLLTLAQTDPVKASLIFQDEDSNYQSAEQELEDNINQLGGNTVSLQQDPTSPNAFVAMLDDALGIQTAHAQMEVIDNALISITTSIHVQNVSQKLEALLKNTLLQILKNTLITLVQRKVLVWIQGSGAPRFITNWSTQLVNAYTQTALSAINSAFSCSYSAFAPQLKLTLRVGYSSQGSVCANSFAASLNGNSFQQFVNNFKNGSWLAFSAGAMPANNYYGNLFFSAQIVDYNGQQARNATQAKSVASQGAKGDQICADGSNPNGISYYCTSSSGKDYTSNTPCGPGNQGQQTAEANNGVCANGQEPNGTTPGIFTVNTENSAGDSSSKLVVAANDIVGVLNAVAGSLLSGLANAAISAAGNAVNGILSVNPTSIQNVAPTPAQIPLACDPSTQTVQLMAASTTASTTGPTALAVIAATGGTTDADGNGPTYSWISSDGTTSTQAFFSDTYTAAGTYTVTLNDSTGDATSTCTVTVQ